MKIIQVAKTGLFPSGVEALGQLGVNLGSAAYWHKAFPYKSSVTGVSGQELADGYDAESGKQWTQQLGATLSLLDAGFDTLKKSADPKSKDAVVKALSTLNTVTIAGKVDFTSGPVPNVSPGPIVGTQWVKAPEGSKFPLDYVVTENATDPNVPVEPSSCPITAEAREATCSMRKRQNRRRPVLGKGIYKRFGSLSVLENVDFSMGMTEAVGIVGPNGAGKTTLLATLAGAFPPSAAVWNSATKCHAPIGGRTLPVGLVRTHQVPKPFLGMTTFENVYVAASHSDVKSRDEAMSGSFNPSTSAACCRSPIARPRRSACSTESGSSSPGRWPPSPK